MGNAPDNKTTKKGTPAARGGGQPLRAVLRCVNSEVLADDAVTEVALKGTQITLGRGLGNDVQVKADGVSRNHSRMVLEHGTWQVEDLDSKNGTRVNSSLVKERRALNNGDTVTIGRACYKFVVTGGTAKASPARSIDLGGNLETVVLSPAQARANLAGTAPGRNIDLGGNLRTVVMTREEAQANLTGRAPAHGTRRAAGATSSADTSRRQRVKSEPRKGSSAVLWIMGVLLVVVVVAVAEFAVGLF